MTKRCNLACPHCFVPIVPVTANTNELSLSQGKAILDDLINSHVYMISFAGGEPLVHKHFLPLATYARELGMTIQVATNGLLLEKIGIDCIIHAGFKCVQISMDGATKSLHEKLRGANTFDCTLSAIRACVAKKLPVVLAVAITKLNQHTLSDIYEFSKKEQVWGVKIQPVITPFIMGNESINLALEAEELKQCINDTKLLFAESGIHLTIINQHLTQGVNKPCNQDLSNAIIFANGTVGICENNESLAVGNILELGFTESWKKARMHWHADKSCCFSSKEQ